MSKLTKDVEYTFDTPITLAEKPFVGWQGEGPSMGVPSLFLRFVGCNLACSFCDSRFTWKKDEMTHLHKTTFGDLVELMRKHEKIIVTGGEPFIPGNKRVLYALLDECGSDRSVEIETNGTVELSSTDMHILHKYKVQLNISPKINIAQDRDVNTIPVMIQQMKYNSIEYIVKFLFDGPEDITMLEGFVKGQHIPKSRVWLQPCGTLSKDVRKLIVDNDKQLLDTGFKVSPRLHVLLYEDLMGV